MTRKLLLATLAALGLLTIPATTQAEPFHHHHRHHHPNYQVQYRQIVWQERLFTCPIEARAFERDKLLQGYEVLPANHGRHVHVRYRPAGWATYQTVHSRHAAFDLERMLEGRGYDARVVR